MSPSGPLTPVVRPVGAIWRALDNRYWPAHYLADAQGRIRYHHFGEGSTDETEAAIRALLAEKGAKLGTTARVDSYQRRCGRLLRRDPQPRNLCRQQPRPVLHIARADCTKGAQTIACRQEYQLNDWGLAGRWTVEPQRAVLAQPGGKIAFRFRARDLHLVLGSASGKPVRFRVTLDGAGSWSRPRHGR